MTDRESADVIVVGAGAAGCVVARRLAEEPSRSVVLLEAGPDTRGALPDEFRNGWQLPQGFDWGYVAEPRYAGEGQRMRRLKLVGGTGWLTRFAPRGAPADFNRWAALGNAGWDFETVLPYLVRIENDIDFGDRPWHGNLGPIPVSRYLGIELTEPLRGQLDALEGLGFPAVEDHNAPGAVGVGRMPMSTRCGKRVTTADAYLVPNQSNLVVRPDTHVAELLFDETRVTGVRCSDHAIIHARCVVLCAGAIGSPLLLMRSGVGPAGELADVGIHARVDLPGVGSNLFDHAGVEIDLGYRGATRDDVLLHVIATFHSSGVPTIDAPDLMLWMSDPVADPGGPPWLGVEVLLMRPEGRGSVRLASADPGEPPRIELPRITDIDIDRLAEGYDVAVELAHHPDVRRVCEAEWSGAPQGVDIRRWIAETLYSYPHIGGTCAMGPAAEDGAVVATDGTVHGTENLSVADASIMPDAPSGFTHFPTVAIAERIAEAVASRLC